MRRTTTTIAAAVCTLALAGLNAPAAFAQGQTERGPENAKSICSFSGLNDDPGEAFPDDGRTQSYGQLVRKGYLVPREIRNGAPSPGTLCNPNNLPLK